MRFEKFHEKVIFLEKKIFENFFLFSSRSSSIQEKKNLKIFSSQNFSATKRFYSQKSNPTNLSGEFAKNSDN